MKKTLIGTALGFSYGCISGMAHAATVLYPAIWIPGSALAGGGVGYMVSGTKGAVIGTIAGTVYGVGCVALYPIAAPLVVAESFLYPAMGAVTGGVIGYNL